MTGLIASGTNVSPSQFLRGEQSAKGAFATWSDSFKFGVFPGLLQEWPGAGVAAGTAYAKLGGGARWTKQGILTAQEMGIIDPSVDSKHPYTMRPENITGNALFQTDPLAWYEQYLKPKLDAMYGEDLASKQAAVQRRAGLKRSEQWTGTRLSATPWPRSSPLLRIGFRI